MLKRTTLSFLFNEKQEVLMIEKKRGMGAGKWNFPGGKIDAAETDEAAARRELVEETGLHAGAIELAGMLEFRFPAGSKSWDNFCRLYRVVNFSGDLISDNEECRCFWWPIAKIPFEKMWADDRFWLPQFLAGQSVFRRYHFDGNDALLSEEIFEGPFGPDDKTK